MPRFYAPPPNFRNNKSPSDSRTNKIYRRESSPNTSSTHQTDYTKMLDIFDFIVEKGGDPNKIKESQRKRYAPEEAVDEVIALYEDARKGIRPSILPFRFLKY